MATAATKITKRTIEAAEPREGRYTIFDSAVPGFGLRVYPTGQMSWIFEYRGGSGGRAGAKQRVTIGKVSDFTPDEARKVADRLRSTVKTGGDPQAEKSERRAAPTVSSIANSFLTKHVDAKRKPGTAKLYRDLLERIVVPVLGTTKAAELKRSDVSKLHLKMKETPFQANRVLAVISSMYVFASAEGLVPEGTNPAQKVERYPEEARGDLLRTEELERLGAAIREAETVGIPWQLDPATADSKHMKKEDRVTRLGEHAAAALRLLIFTGCRLREILNLRWDQVDFERGLLLLGDHKTSRKTGVKAIVLNAPALSVLSGLTRIGKYVIAGNSAGLPHEKPRSDLKKPWMLVRDRAGLQNLRLHDLRHNFASVGITGGMRLPLVGKLLGHTQPATTARYSHLDNDPLRRASNSIGAAIAAAMGDAPAPETEKVVTLPRGKRGG